MPTTFHADTPAKKEAGREYEALCDIIDDYNEHGWDNPCSTSRNHPGGLVLKFSDIYTVDKEGYEIVSKIQLTSIKTFAVYAASALTQFLGDNPSLNARLCAELQQSRSARNPLVDHEVQINRALLPEDSKVSADPHQESSTISGELTNELADGIWNDLVTRGLTKDGLYGASALLDHLENYDVQDLAGDLEFRKNVCLAPGAVVLSNGEEADMSEWYITLICPVSGCWSASEAISDEVFDFESDSA